MILDLPSLIILAGSSKSGKTHTTKSLILSHSLEGNNCFNFGMVFTSTKFNCDYTTFLPEKSVMEGFDIGIINRFLNKIKREYGDRIKKNIKKGKPSHLGVPASFIVFDDIITLINQNNKDWKTFISTSRHYNISIFISVQYIHQVTPLSRQQADYAFIFHHDQDKSIKALYESFGGLFKNKNEFSLFLHENTKERYSCIVYLKDAYERDEKYKNYKSQYPLKNVKLKF